MGWPDQWCKGRAEGTDVKHSCWETILFGLLNFCTNHEQSTGCLWPQIILSKMLIWTRALEDIVFLWSKGQTCLLSNIKCLGFLNTVFLHAEVSSGPLHDTPWELLPQNADTLTTAIVKNNKFLCL